MTCAQALDRARYLEAQARPIRMALEKAVRDWAALDETQEVVRQEYLDMLTKAVLPLVTHAAEAAGVNDANGLTVHALLDEARAERDRYFKLYEGECDLRNKLANERETLQREVEGLRGALEDLPPLHPGGDKPRWDHCSVCANYFDWRRKHRAALAPAEPEKGRQG